MVELHTILVILGLILVLHVQLVVVVTTGAMVMLIVMVLVLLIWVLVNGVMSIVIVVVVIVREIITAVMDIALPLMNVLMVPVIIGMLKIMNYVQEIHGIELVGSGVLCTLPQKMLGEVIIIVTLVQIIRHVIVGVDGNLKV
jgi:hypothetical protein